MTTKTNKASSFSFDVGSSFSTTTNVTITSKQSTGGNILFEDKYTDVDALPLSIEREMTKPKRPLSAYNFFYKVERAKLLGLDINDTIEEERMGLNSRPVKRARKHRKTPGMIGFKELAKKVSTKWRSMSKEERQPYQEMFEEDRERYQREMMAWTTCQPVRDEWRFNASSPSSSSSLAIAAKGTNGSTNNNGEGCAVVHKPIARRVHSSSSFPGYLGVSHASAHDGRAKSTIAHSRTKADHSGPPNDGTMLRNIGFDLLSEPKAIAQCQNVTSMNQVVDENRLKNTISSDFFNDDEFSMMRDEDAYLTLKNASVSTSTLPDHVGQQNIYNSFMTQPVVYKQTSMLPEGVFVSNQTNDGGSDDHQEAAYRMMMTQMMQKYNPKTSSNESTINQGAAVSASHGMFGGEEENICCDNIKRSCVLNQTKNSEKRRQSASMCMSFFNKEDDMKLCPIFPEEQGRYIQGKYDHGHVLQEGNTINDDDMLDLEGDLAALCEDEALTSAS